jgi:hypothetical protein
VSSERAAATPLLLAAAGLALLMTVLVADLGIVLAGRYRAAVAADAAALAAAPVTFRPFGASGSPAREAARLAAANGAALVSCGCPVDTQWRRRTVRVVVSHTVELIGPGRVTVVASSSAEFDPLRLVGLTESLPGPSSREHAVGGERTASRQTSIPTGDDPG